MIIILFGIMILQPKLQVKHVLVDDQVVAVIIINELPNSRFQNLRIKLIVVGMLNNNNFLKSTSSSLFRVSKPINSKSYWIQKLDFDPRLVEKIRDIISRDMLKMLGNLDLSRFVKLR